MTRDGPMWDPGIWEGIREAMREETERAAAARVFLPHVIVGSEVTSIVSQEFAWAGGSGNTVDAAQAGEEQRGDGFARIVFFGET